MCKKHNLEQALRGLSLIINPLCNTVALRSMAILYNDTETKPVPWISVPPFIELSEGYFKISRSRYHFYTVKKMTSNSDILTTQDTFYNYSLFSEQLLNNAVQWRRTWQHPRIHTRYEGNKSAARYRRSSKG